MGAVGDLFDNALMGNFWSALKIELVYHNAWRTRDDADNVAMQSTSGLRAVTRTGSRPVT